MTRVAVAAGLVVAYEWWATGIAPFSTLAYALVAVPSIIAPVLYASMGAFSSNRADMASYTIPRH